ncbi:MAG: hypothetical protein K2F94_06190 [Muribaculaceae bacterium]|nr:hypothetical protein [Muribaculaceae bacterium]
MKDKILIAYFEQKNHQNSKCRRVADDISTALFEKEYTCTEFSITPVESYPVDNREEFDRIVHDEIENDARPSVLGGPGAFYQYHVVVLVIPNWFDNAPMAVYSFLDMHDFADKVVIPVVCHSGDGGEAIRESIRLYMPMADVLTGADVVSDADDSHIVDGVAAQVLTRVR